MRVGGGIGQTAPDQDNKALLSALTNQPSPQHAERSLWKKHSGRKPNVDQTLAIKPPIS